MISLSATSFVYDGTEKKPSVTVKTKDNVIDEINYTITYKDNINVGKASVIVTATENKVISGSVTVSFEIIATEFLGEFSKIENAVYNGQNQFPEITIENYTKNTDYTLSFKYKKLDANDSTYTNVK